MRFAEEEQTEETRAQRADAQDVMSGPEEVREGRGSGKGKGNGIGGKGELGSKGSLGRKGTQVAQQSTRTMNGTDEDGEEIQHEEECDCWDCTHCWEYIDDVGVERGPFRNWEMRDWWQK